MTLSDSTLKHRARFKTAGILALVLGTAGSVTLYWIRTHAQYWAGDPALAGYSGLEDRQMALLYGKSGLMTSDLLEAVKRPGTQAALVAVISILVAWVCFFLARRWVDGDESARPAQHTNPSND